MAPTPLDRARQLVRDVPDFPQPGILFKDLAPVLADAAAFRALLDPLEAWLRGWRVQRIAAIEARGFLFGAALADRLGVGLAPVRKLGKLPFRTDRVEYALEYGTGVLEAHADAFVRGERVAIVDDLLATGGTAAAAAQLVERQGGQVVGFAFGVELPFLEGRARLNTQAAAAPVEAALSFGAGAASARS